MGGGIADTLVGFLLHQGMLAAVMRGGQGSSGSGSGSGSGSSSSSSSSSSLTLAYRGLQRHPATVCDMQLLLRAAGRQCGDKAPKALSQLLLPRCNSAAAREKKLANGAVRETMVQTIWPRAPFGKAL